MSTRTERVLVGKLTLAAEDGQLSVFPLLIINYQQEQAK